MLQYLGTYAQYPRYWNSLGDGLVGAVTRAQGWMTELALPVGLTLQTTDPTAE
jgi:hypothetical protein